MNDTKTNIDSLIDTYLQQEVNWSLLNMRHAQASVKYRIAKAMADAGYPEHTEAELFEMQLNVENLKAESQRLMRINCDWGFYASALLGVKMMEDGDEFANEAYVAVPLRMMKDKLIAAVSNPQKMKRLRDWDAEEQVTVIDLGNIFRLQLNELEKKAKEEAKRLFESANTSEVAIAA